jgi:hypothetical protein
MPILQMTSLDEIVSLVEDNLNRDPYFRHWCGYRLADHSDIDVSMFIDHKLVAEIAEIHIGNAYVEPRIYNGRPFTMGLEDDLNKILMGYVDVLVENAKLEYCSRLENK